MLARKKPERPHVVANGHAERAFFLTYMFIAEDFAYFLK